MDRTKIRDLGIIVCLMLALAAITLTPARKMDPAKRTELSARIPKSVGPWQSKELETKDYRDRWQSINELLVRRYFKENIATLRGPGVLSVAFIAEYSSDLRQNFSFHFPENCHRAGGNEVQSLTPLEVRMDDGRLLKAKRIFIRGRAGTAEEVDKMVTYWLVIGKQAYWQTLFIKLDQMVSGLLSQGKEGYLVRVDYDQDFEYSAEGIDKASRLTSMFLKDLYGSLSPQERDAFFGAQQNTA